MTRRMFEFKCPEDHITERLVQDHEHTVLCMTCNREANRILSAPHISVRMGVDTTSAQANRWAKMHRDEAKRQNAKIDPNPSS